MLLVLADHAHDDGSGAYPSVKRIAAKARLSERAVQYALRRLEAEGHIEHAGNGPRGTIEYRLLGLGGADIAPGGALHDIQGVQSSAPEPSLEPSNNRARSASGGTAGRRGARSHRGRPTSARRVDEGFKDRLCGDD